MAALWRQAWGLPSGAERVYALNLPEFTRLAPSELREKVGTVS